MNKDGIISQTLEKTMLTRRSFLKWSGVLGGTVALTGGVGLGFKVLDKAVAEEVKEGKWIPAPCWLDCGSKGFNKAYVVDGVIVRMGTDETVPESPDCPPLRSCGKGRASRNSYLNPTRLKYPMKRKNWEPGGGKKELRGKDEWVRISWDEALDIVSSELMRVRDAYGQASIYSCRPGTYLGRFLDLFGGFLQGWGAYSGGTWREPGKFNGFPASFNDRIDLRKTQLFVLWGSNPAWSRAGLPTYYYTQYKKAGAKFIFVDPLYNATAQVLADEWVPVRPATDHALILGMAHTLLVEDDPATNPLIDWDFLNRCTIGFDKDHMPEGADPKENFVDYVLGTYDGEPKTAEWAAEICGTPPEKIRALAREIAMTEHVVIAMSTSPSRVHNADSWPPVVMTFGAMTGHLGKSGSCVAQDGGHKTISNGGQALIRGGSSRSFNHPFQRAEPIGNALSGGGMGGASLDIIPLEKDGIPHTILGNVQSWPAVLEGKYQAAKDDIRPLNVQLMYHGHESKLTNCVGVMKGIEAHRKVEFVVTQNVWFNPDAQYSDVVLPVTSRWERYGDLAEGFREQLLWTHQLMEPWFEAKDDIWIARELGVRCGLDPKVIEPWSLKQEIFNQVADARVMNEDGETMEPLVTITNKDIQEFGVEGEPQQGRIPIKEFQEKGIYHVPRKEGDNYGSVALRAFRKDPENSPVKSASGKLEIHCQSYADYIKHRGWSEIRPIPTYNPPVEGYEDTFADWKNKVKGEYPLQKFDLHVARRTHSNYDNTPWLRETYPREVYMNSIDAAERGIKDGDTVLIRSRHGKVLRIVTVTDRIIPGAIAIGWGSWIDIDEETGIDMGGATNTLSGAIATGQEAKGYNSCNVQVEKWTGAPLLPDHLKPPKVPLKDENL